MSHDISIEEPRESLPLAVLGEMSDRTPRFRERAELGRRLGASEGYLVLASDGRHVGIVDHVRYARHAEHPDEIVVRRRNVLWRRPRRSSPFGAVGAVDPASRTCDPHDRQQGLRRGNRLVNRLANSRVCRGLPGETRRVTETLSPELVAGLTITSGLGFAMVWLVSRKCVIEERGGARRCRSCGLLVRPGSTCACSTRPR